MSLNDFKIHSSWSPGQNKLGNENVDHNACEESQGQGAGHTCCSQVTQKGMEAQTRRSPSNSSPLPGWER